MRFLRQSIAPFAALVLLCGFLSACAADAPQPTILAAPSGGPSPSAAVTSPSPGQAVAAPDLPAEAREQTAAGAIAFVRHYFAVVDYAYATGDTAPLANISDPDCRPCAGIQEMITIAFASGGSYRRSRGVVADLSLANGDPPGPVEIHLTYRSDGAVQLDSLGGELRHLQPAVDEPYRVILDPSEGGWLIYDYSEI